MVTPSEGLERDIDQCITPPLDALALPHHLERSRQG